MSPPSSPSTSRPGSPTSVVDDTTTPTKPFRFNFEPRKGPESISGLTDGRGHDYFGAPPGLVLLSSSSTSFSLAALPEEWSSSTYGFHAISTVLNNPHKSQAPPKAHSHLPPVPPAELPRVRRKDFDSYLRAVAPEWDRFVQNNQLGRDGVARLSPSRDSPSPRPRTLLPDLDTVPSVFLRPNFDLGDPNTFALVTEQGDEPYVDDLSSLSRSLPLLEKFSHYADTVEQHLVREISQRSTSFFAALTNLHDLQSESEQCLERISQLRVLLKEVDEKSAKRGMQVVHKELKMNNMSKVKEGVSFVSGVIEMTTVAKNLVEAGQWSESLSILDTLKKMWDNESVEPTIQHPSTNGRLPGVSEESEEAEEETESPAPSIPLSSLKAFSSLPEHLRLLTLDIASSLATELVEILRTDLQSRFRNEDYNESRRESLQRQMKPVLIGLQRTNGLKEATLSWREAALAEMRAVVKQYISSFEDDEDLGSDSSSLWIESVRKMPHDEFVDVLTLLFQTFLRGLNGLRDGASLFVETLQNIGTTNEEDVLFAQEELADISSSAAELSNTLAAKVISKRAEQHSTLTLLEFYTFFNVAWDFVVQCEVLCRRMIVGLRGVIVSQAKIYLQVFHQERLNKLSKLVEDELWSSVEVSSVLQHAVDTIIDAAVHSPPDLSLDTPSTNGNGSKSPSLPSTNGTSHAAAKHLRIEDRPYFTVSATNQVLLLLQDYLRVIVNLNTLTTDAMSRVIEFLKAFNSRTCQVVLGAGAMRSAGLKNITAKHLALASQSLSIMVSLIPYIREAFRRHLNSKQAIMLVEFDKLKRDYQEHQNEIHTKLIAIMGDRLTAHIQSLQAINWDSSKPGDGVNSYMQLLVKETVLLHKVLSRYLSPPIVEYVMTQVFAAINHRLSEEYGRIDLPHQEAKNRLLGDAKFLHQSLSGIKNVSAQSGMLETVISEKSIAYRPPPSPSATVTSPPTRSNTLSNANARLKGLLSASKSVTLPTPPEKSEKPLPSPTLASTFVGTPSPRKEFTSPLPSASPPLPYVTGREKLSLENGSGYSESIATVDSPGVVTQELPEEGLER